ncbi:hypothetical protein NQ315_001198 [Exocentrus adspersus]|uniref:RRM domain-containing protein n=1 Tax=Exocentrus adspersus TaxID=1586481 RepID=A0AAV8WFM4_9CUCU|nr:hypothetical protein NQ315_001198 [Exocentrus adspersus]
MYRTDKQFMKNPATAASRIYIGSLAKTVIADDLEAKFRVHGTILGLVLNTGFAFIQFDNENEAQAAIKGENGSILNGRKIVVKQALTDRRQSGGGPQGNQNFQRQGNQGPQGNQGSQWSGGPQGNQNQQRQGQQGNQGPGGPPGPRPSPGGPPNQNQATPQPENKGPPPQSPTKPQTKTPPPPTQTPQQEPPPGNEEVDRSLQFQPPEREQEPQDENMEDDRPNIRPPGPQMQHNDRGRKGGRKPPPHRGPDRGGPRGRSNERNRFHDRDRYDHPPQDMYRDDQYYGDRDFMPPGPGARPEPFAAPITEAPPPPEKNDCEIIVVSKALTEYAEFIEQKLKNLGLVVDLLFPNEDVPIGKVLANISSRGCLYAILIMPQNEENRSLTLDVLHGVPQEHRNMPLEDALILISRNFEGYMKGEQFGPDNPVALNLNDRHSSSMQMLINLLAENRQLTSTQYDRLIKYLEERRELQREYEVAEGIEPQDPQEADPKAVELQSRILNILNKSNEPPIPTSITAPNPAPQQEGQTPILKDPTVQKALDSLLMGDMFKSMAGNA